MRRLLLFLVLWISLSSSPAHAYSLLTHEQLIDMTWQSSIVPLLRSRYPTITPAELEQARAYAYGGCVIQDIGYYPFGDSFFSDLTHYVRSGDFVVNLFRNAGNANELAFAVGALSHYIGDTIGHPEATNIAVPVEFPKLGQRYGPVVNYAQGEHQHVQTEFAFDIAMISHHRLAPVHYLRHVGLEVPSRQVALAFYQTYGLKEGDGRTARVNVGGYRFAVRRFIPRIAYAVTLLHRHDEPQEPQTPELQKLDAEVARIAKENNWDDYRKKAGIGTYLLAGLLKVLPKIGPIKLVAVKGPTGPTEAEYVHSVLQSTEALNRALHRFTPPPATAPTADVAARGQAPGPPPRVTDGQTQSPAEKLDPLHPLANRDLDTGQKVKPAGYPLTDSTYALLLHRLALAPAQPVPPGIKTDILAYYDDLTLQFATRKKPAQWAAVQQDLNTLLAMPTSTEQDPFKTYDDQAGTH